MRSAVALAALAATVLARPAAGADEQNWMFDACLTVEGQESGGVMYRVAPEGDLG